MQLAYTERQKKEKLDVLRASGRMPAVFYGPKEEAKPITIAMIDFLKVWKDAGESTVVELKGDGEAKEALIHDIDFDPVSGTPRHVDFYVIEKGKKVQVPVAIEFVGEAPALKAGNATLVKVLHEIEIEAFPKDLPHELTVDVSGLVDFDSQILVQDIKLPAGVTALTEPEEVVALISEVKEEIDEAAPVDLEAIEVVDQKGKKEEEGEAATEE